MSSKMQQRIQHARSRRCFVLRLPVDLRASNRLSWTVYVEGELDHRGAMSHRAAKNLAYAISVAKHHKLEVTFG